MAFVKGQSGNPGGRPKRDREVEELAKAQGPAAIRRLTEIMTQTEDLKVAKAAADSLLDRGYGKPIQQIKQQHDFGKLAEELTDEELASTVLGEDGDG
jgi:hypothetical protein